MIVSPGKLEDMRWRLTLLHMLQDAYQNNCPLTVKEIGKTTQWLAHRIKTHDYSARDKLLIKIKET